MITIFHYIFILKVTVSFEGLKVENRFMLSVMVWPEVITLSGELRAYSCKVVDKFF